ncbi:MAG: LexA family protein [Thermoguttaceae bacterium]
MLSTLEPSLLPTLEQGFVRKVDVGLTDIDPIVRPVALETIPAGFPSPAENSVGEHLDLSGYLVARPESTFFMRVSGDSMIGAGIFDGDLLIVDRSLVPSSGDIVIAILNGELTVKRLFIDRQRIELRPENHQFRVIRLTDESALEIWGVVTSSIKSFR